MKLQSNPLLMMSKTLTRITLLFIAFLSYPLMAQEYKVFSVLGTSEAVCKPGIETREQLQDFFANDKETVDAILADANWEGDSELLHQAIAAGNFSERFYEKGTTFHWTSSKKKGVPTALPNRIWGGEEAFKGFEANIESGCNVHQIVIPHACCNVSLASVTPVEVPTPVITVKSDNEDVTICSNHGSEVVITDATGTNRTVPLDASGCWVGRVSPGAITAAVVHENECGVAAADVNHQIAAAPAPAVIAPAAAPIVEKSPGLIPFIGAFAGAEDRMKLEPAWDTYYGDSTDVIGVKVGLIKPLSESWSIFTQLGYLDRSGISDRLIFSDDTLFVDVGADRNIGNGFIGGGAGYWNIGDTDFDDVSLFVHGGIGLGSTNLQLFAEGRVFGEELDDIGNNNMVTGGIRYLFK